MSKMLENDKNQTTECHVLDAGTSECLHSGTKSTNTITHFQTFRKKINYFLTSSILGNKWVYWFYFKAIEETLVTRLLIIKFHYRANSQTNTKEKYDKYTSSNKPNTHSPLCLRGMLFFFFFFLPLHNVATQYVFVLLWWWWWWRTNRLQGQQTALQKRVEKG